MDQEEKTLYNITIQNPVDFILESSKLRVELIQPEWTEQLARVLTYGAQKHGALSFLENNYNYSQLIGSYKRHLLNFEKGYDYDEETEELNLAHAATNILMLLTYKLRNKGVDDRNKID